mgnify:CR=1 FL=1
MHRGAAGLLVVAINILSYNDQVRFFLKLNQSQVSGIGLTFGNELPPPVIPLPDEISVGKESAAGGQFFGAVLTPEGVFTAAKCGNAAGG